MVKAVIRDLAPHAIVIDLTHEIPPHDIRAGSLARLAVHPVRPGRGWCWPSSIRAWARPGGRSRSRSPGERASSSLRTTALIAPAVAMTRRPGPGHLPDQHGLPPALPGATFAGRDLFAPRRRAPLQRRRVGEPRGCRRAGRARAGRHPGAPQRAGTASSPRCCGSTASATRSSTSGPDDLAGWGDVTRLLVGWRGPHSPPGGHLRRDRCRGDRPVLDSYGPSPWR